MRARSLRGIRALVFAALVLRWTPVAPQRDDLDAAEVCADFTAEGYPGSAWTFVDCAQVWAHFVDTLLPYVRTRAPHVDIWRDTAKELRRIGSPCIVSSLPTRDGAGSSTIRHLATWVLSIEMGCDWATPSWGGSPPVPGANGATMYCHRTATTAEMDLSRPAEELWAMRRCSIVNWLAYFQFDVPSVDLPVNKTSDILLKGDMLKPPESLIEMKERLHRSGFSNIPSDRVAITFHPSVASQHLISSGSWDATRREIVRGVLAQARTNFHRHPRPWYDENPECAFSPEALDFAVHVRMGDRREFLDGGNDGYFQLLETFMGTISAGVLERGLPQPVFHIFSETLKPCPSQITGLFDEFPAWPVDLNEIPDCVAAKAPLDCPEKRAGAAFCAVDRSGVFHVQGKSIVLHVGPDVQNAVSCMIQADGVLMGCSTFGQIGGIFTKGISFFSMQCGGNVTPDQYKMIPPLAIAENGHMWVPVAGSWRDPVLMSTTLYTAALDELLATRNALVQP